MNGSGPPGYADDLETILAEAWRLLARGVADRRSPFHTICVANVDAAGAPSVRTVVLRGVDVPGRTLRFHTDLRSQKASDLARDPRIAVHGYDPGAKVQIRVSGRASIHTDDAVADAAWASSRPFSRVCYGVVPAPGDPIETGGDFALPETEAEIAAGRANFAAVLIAVERLEWLYLAHSGHRRAAFLWDDPARLQARWLTP